MASMQVRAHGDTADELEADALRQAGEFFGGRPVRLVRAYQAFAVGSPGTESAKRAAGKTHYANIAVIEVIPESFLPWLARLLGRAPSPD